MSQRPPGHWEWYFGTQLRGVLQFWPVGLRTQVALPACVS